MGDQYPPREPQDVVPLPTVPADTTSTTVSRPDVPEGLPATGVAATEWAVGGLLLAAVGVALVVAARRRRR